MNWNNDKKHHQDIDRYRSEPGVPDESNVRRQLHEQGIRQLQSDAPVCDHRAQRRNQRVYPQYNYDERVYRPQQSAASNDDDCRKHRVEAARPHEKSTDRAREESDRPDGNIEPARHNYERQSRGRDGQRSHGTEYI